jgi:hypothetical protein
MGYLEIYNNNLSGNTFRMYLSDYGKSRLALGNGVLDEIQKFGLGDLDIDYRRFVGSGECRDQTGLSALTGSCFFDLPDARGGEPSYTKGAYNVIPSIFRGARITMQSNVPYLYNTSLGVNPTNTTTLWAKHKEKETVTDIEEPNSGDYNTCWLVGDSVTRFYPAYCIVCADFNGDGRVDMDDLKIFLSLMGANATKGSDQLIGDFNGDGKVDKKDLMIFIDCLRYNNVNILNLCQDKEIYCLLCKHLGTDSPCGGDCLKCI